LRNKQPMLMEVQVPRPMAVQNRQTNRSPMLMEVQAPRPMAVQKRQTHRSHRAHCSTTNPTFCLWYASCAQAASFCQPPTRYVFHHHILIFLPSDSRPLSFHALLPAPCQTRHPESSKLEKITDGQTDIPEETQTDEETDEAPD
jgi:hypothetical protein